MIKKIILPALLIYMALPANSQTYTTYAGKVLDQKNQPLAYARVELRSKNSSKTISTNKDGEFVFKNINTSEFSLLFYLMGYTKKMMEYNIKGGKNIKLLPSVILIEEPFNLNEVSIIGERKKIEVKIDTIQYNTEHYKLSVGSTAGDILKKIPGSIITASGQFLLHGQNITKIKVNGKDFLDGDFSQISGMIPADLIDNVQLIKDYGSIANITGNKSGASEKILNINLKTKFKKGYFGNGLIGGGTNNRYLADGALTIQNQNQQLSLVGNLSNSNISKGGSGRISDIANGENKSKSIGINYTNEISEKVSLYGNYILNNNNMSSDMETFRETTYSNYNILSYERTNNNNKSKTSRGSFNMEIKPSKKDYIKLSPEIELSSNYNSTMSDILTINGQNETRLNNRSLNDSKLPKFGGSLIYNRTFNKPGRNLTLNFLESIDNESTFRNIKNVDGDIIFQNAEQKTNIDTKNKKSLLGLGYIEPVSKHSFIDGSISFNNEISVSNINTTLIDENGNPIMSEERLNDKYKSSFKNTTFTGSYRLTNRQMNLSVGLNVLHTILEGKSHETNANSKIRETNYAPGARFAFLIANSKTISAEYNGISAAPKIDQLLPVRDIQNVQNIIIGNPDLKPEFRNTYKLHYNSINVKSGRSFFIGFDYNTTRNKIIQTRLSNIDSLGQRTSYINGSGARSSRISYSWTIPLSDNKWVLVFMGSSDNSNNISYLNETKNVGKSWVGNQQIHIKSEINQKLDNQLTLDYNISRHKTSNNENETSLGALKCGINGNYSIIPKSIIGYDVSKTINHGFKGISNSNPLILNFYYEQRFFRNNSTSIKLIGLDLLNQNTGISSDVFYNTISNTRSNRISRYFMMTIKYNFQSIDTKS